MKSVIMLSSFKSINTIDGYMRFVMLQSLSQKHDTGSIFCYPLYSKTLL